MPHFRLFSDAAGRTWHVWSVRPGDLPGRPHSVTTGDERFARTLPQLLRDGWLAFQSGQEQRHLAPIPAGWEQADEAGLLALLGDATPAMS